MLNILSDQTKQLQYQLPVDPSLEKDFDPLLKKSKFIGIIDGNNVAIDSTK